jgi:hypothetical protein
MLPILLCDAGAVACTLRDAICTDACVSGSGPSSYVDMYNATSNTWTSYSTGLGQARTLLAGASLASGLVFFAGGSSSALFVMCGWSELGVTRVCLC